MSASSDPSFSTTDTLIKSVRRDLGEISARLSVAAGFAREAQATLWEIDRRQQAADEPSIDPRSPAGGEAVAWDDVTAEKARLWVLDAPHRPGCQSLTTAAHDGLPKACSCGKALAQAALRPFAHPAVEALEKVRNTTHHSTGYPDLSARRAAHAVAVDALASLEGK